MKSTSSNRLSLSLRAQLKLATQLLVLLVLSLTESSELVSTGMTDQLEQVRLELLSRGN